MSMRVLMYSHSYVVEANHAKLEHLARMPDVDLSLICPTGVRRELATYRVERHEHPDYRIVPLRIAYPSHNYRFFYWSAGRAIRRLAPELIHIEEEPWSIAAWQAVRHRRRDPNVKIIVFTWQNLPAVYDFPHEGIRRKVLAAADAVIAGNAEAADRVRAQGYARPVHVLPQFGVDETLYARQDAAALRAELGLTGTVIGYLGRLVPEKGVDLLLDAASCLQGDWSLLVIGGGAERAETARRLAAAPFEGRSRLLDTVPHTDVTRYLSCMDVLVLPSREAPHWKEQFGHVLIEAMACETAVVGSTCGEIPNVIGEAGAVFPEGDADILRSVLQEIVDSPALRAELASEGRQRVLQQYTNRRIAQATHDIYSEVLAQ
jgi:glycosyltransferase involved in cell wall biosynthesis